MSAYEIPMPKGKEYPQNQRHSGEENILKPGEQNFLFMTPNPNFPPWEVKRPGPEGRCFLDIPGYPIFC